MSITHDLSARAETLLGMAGDSQDYSRSRAAKYYEQINGLLRDGRQVVGSLSRQQTIELSRIASSLQSEFQF